jgi:hypothetical protein
MRRVFSSQAKPDPKKPDFQEAYQKVKQAAQDSQQKVSLSNDSID